MSLTLFYLLVVALLDYTSWCECAVLPLPREITGPIVVEKFGDNSNGIDLKGYYQSLSSSKSKGTDVGVILPPSPADLLKPDGFHFYAYNEKGDMITRQMTVEEIQALIAAGGPEHTGMEIQEPQKADEILTTGNKVMDVVEKVQSVLKSALGKPSTWTGTVSMSTVPLQANEEWSNILPGILAGDMELHASSPENNHETASEDSQVGEEYSANASSSADATNFPTDIVDASSAVSFRPVDNEGSISESDEASSSPIPNVPSDEASNSTAVLNVPKPSTATSLDSDTSSTLIASTIGTIEKEIEESPNGTTAGLDAREEETMLPVSVISSEVTDLPANYSVSTSSSVLPIEEPTSAKLPSSEAIRENASTRPMSTSTPRSESNYSTVSIDVTSSETSSSKPNIENSSPLPVISEVSLEGTEGSNAEKATTKSSMDSPISSDYQITESPASTSSLALVESLSSESVERDESTTIIISGERMNSTSSTIHSADKGEANEMEKGDNFLEGMEISGTKWRNESTETGEHVKVALGWNAMSTVEAILRTVTPSADKVTGIAETSDLLGGNLVPLLARYPTQNMEAQTVASSLIAGLSKSSLAPAITSTTPRAWRNATLTDEKETAITKQETHDRGTSPSSSSSSSPSPMLTASAGSSSESSEVLKRVVTDNVTDGSVQSVETAATSEERVETDEQDLSSMSTEVSTNDSNAGRVTSEATPILKSDESSTSSTQNSTAANSNLGNENKSKNGESIESARVPTMGDEGVSSSLKKDAGTSSGGGGTRLEEKGEEEAEEEKWQLIAHEMAPTPIEKSTRKPTRTEVAEVAGMGNTDEFEKKKKDKEEEEKKETTTAGTATMSLTGENEEASSTTERIVADGVMLEADSAAAVAAAAVALDSSTRETSSDIVKFSRLCNEIAFKFWMATNRGLSTARSLALSPFGMTSLLAMIFLGARGTTSDEMNEVLGLDNVASFNPHLIFQNVTDTVSLARLKEQGVANAAFVREIFADRLKVRKLMPFYKEQAQQFYEGLVAEVNFATISDLVRRRTNLLIRKQTGGRIKDFVRNNAVPLRSPLAAISANVFETDCSNSTLVSSAGRDGELYFAVSSEMRLRRLVPVPATVWRRTLLAGYEPTLDATGIALGTRRELVSTIFLLPGQQGHLAPGDSLDRLEERLLSGALKEEAWEKVLKVLVPRPGLELQLPKFTHRSIVNVTAALRRMGLEKLFSRQADLKGINGVGHHLFFTDVLQMNLFSTCGDESAASNGRHHTETYPASTSPRGRQEREREPSMGHSAKGSYMESEKEEKAAGSKEAPRLKLDQPFLYFVRHNPTGMILHMGRFNPSFP